MSTNLVVLSTLRRAFAMRIDQVANTDSLRAWCPLAYVFPGLHPDGYEDVESRWWRLVTEAWCRVDAGELADEELYSCDAQCAGIYERPDATADENRRRLKIAARCGAIANV